MPANSCVVAMSQGQSTTLSVCSVIAHFTKQFVKSELRKGAGTASPVQLDRRAVTNMQDVGAKNDAAIKG